MSKDNRIVILVTESNRVDKAKPLEFRVKEVQAAENITHNPDVRRGFNSETVSVLFKDCEVFHKESDAWRLAIKMEDESDYVEYGIERMDFSHLRFPEQQPS